MIDPPASYVHVMPGRALFAMSDLQQLAEAALKRIIAEIEEEFPR